MRRLSGFSLMEMMTVLLIVSVVAAASAPMINKRMMVNQGTGNCPWERLGDGSISYNQDAGNRSVIIGANATNNGLSPKLHIRTTDNDPLITFERDGVNEQLALRYRANTVGLSNINPGNGATAVGIIAGAGDGSTVIGNNARAFTDGIALGTSAVATQKNSISIGNQATAIAVDAIAIGGNHGECLTQATNLQSIAIGRAAVSAGSGSVALGDVARADSIDSIAIGTGANAVEAARTIAIGSGALADKSNAIAIGYGCYASSDVAIAIGKTTWADKPAAISIGRSCEAGKYSIAIGDAVKARGTNMVVIGSTKQVSDNASNSVVIGTSAYTDSAKAVAIGHKKYKIVN